MRIWLLKKKNDSARHDSCADNLSHSLKICIRVFMVNSFFVVIIIIVVISLQKLANLWSIMLVNLCRIISYKKCKF